MKVKEILIITCLLSWLYNSLIGVSGFSGMEWRTGMLEWNGGLEYWNGMVEWNGGMEWWNSLSDIPNRFHNQKACHK